jgi:hypothetical protein
MAGYPQAKIHTESYVWYLKNYGYFVAYYRFEEYSVILSQNLGSKPVDLATLFATLQLSHADFREESPDVLRYSDIL